MKAVAKLTIKQHSGTTAQLEGSGTLSGGEGIEAPWTISLQRS
jgi:hypothetical protein